MSDKFIKLTDSDDNSTITVNTRYIVKASRQEDDEVTTITMSDDYSDLEVEETPEKVYSLINKAPTSSSASLSDHPETPPKASTQALTNDPHMENLSRHA